MEERIFSGIQPTGVVHIGNYLGAIEQWVREQYNYKSFFCIVDYHAITVPFDPAAMQDQIFDAAVVNIAAGLDPDVATIFVQSHVPEHTELTWILNALTPMGRLSHMTQFKEKSRRLETVNVGLFDYPVLQAADILLYKASCVPVGEDQIQHIELTRDIARKFNVTYGDTFPEVRAALSETPRVMALNDPEKKMSKSILGSYIGLADEPETIRARIMKAVTDTGPQPQGEMSLGVANLFLLLKGFSSPETVTYFLQTYSEGTIRYSALKKTLAEDIIKKLEPVRRKREELLANPRRVHEILQRGANEARSIARETIREVKEKMGLRYRSLDEG